MGARASAALFVFLSACGGNTDPPPDAAVSPIGPVPEYEQREGDADAGWQALINNGYVGCGVPMSAYAKVASPAPLELRLDRAGANATLPYNLTAFTTKNGVEVVSPNCLQCHAETLNGQLVIGLGNHTADYTDDLSSYANLSEALVAPEDHDEWQRWRDRVVAVGPYTITKTIGVNPADNLAAVLFAHRDADTLAWSDEALFPPPPAVVVPVDVPPWWRMRKKHAMFYDAAGRGDHARIMMTASTLCVDSVEEARAIDAYFPDVRAFLLTLEPPAWTGAVDAALAARGEVVFHETCERCHGTSDSYPNMIVALDEIGTDPTLALGAAQFAGEPVDWFNRSFFGEIAFLAPAPGYVAPPLDGVWATAPFLHNGSVPTLRALLDSRLRPRFFQRSYDTSDYDAANLGWRYTELDHGQDEARGHDERVVIYDTTQLGYGNGGHTFGDDLTEADRTALLEYVKTL
jgi:mono/diheme cytochrome c family protein